MNGRSRGILLAVRATAARFPAAGTIVASCAFGPLLATVAWAQPTLTASGVVVPGAAPVEAMPLAPSPPAPEMKRLALVIGNAAYAPPLKNPLNDAQAMTSALSKVGWEVTTLTNAKPADVWTFVEQFGEFVAPGDEVVFYYSGHGVQLEGENYLLPVGVNYRTEAEVRTQSLPLANLFEILDRSRPRSLVIILDACRDNPFPPSFRPPARGGLRKGLAAIENPPSRSLIAFAASEGETASDGTGEHGTFTEALLEQLPRPYLSALDVLTEVNRAVRERTNNEQVPEFKVKLDYAFHFNPALPPAPSVTQSRPGEVTVQFLDQTESYRVNPPGTVEQVAELARLAVSRSVGAWRETLRDDVERLNFVHGRMQVLEGAVGQCQASGGLSDDTVRLTQARKQVGDAIASSQLALAVGIVERALEQAPSACRPTDWTKIAMISAGAVGVAGVVGGSILFYLASDNWDQAQTACPGYVAGVGCPAGRGPELSRTAQSQAQAATWVYAVGGAGLATASALWIYDYVTKPKLETDPSQPQLGMSVSLSPDRAELGVKGSFF